MPCDHRHASVRDFPVKTFHTHPSSKCHVIWNAFDFVDPAFVASSAFVNFLITMFLQKNDKDEIKNANIPERYHVHWGMNFTIIGLTAILLFLGLAFPQYLNDF